MTFREKWEENVFFCSRTPRRVVDSILLFFFSFLLFRLVFSSLLFFSFIYFLFFWFFSFLFFLRCLHFSRFCIHFLHFCIHFFDSLFKLKITSGFFQLILYQLFLHFKLCRFPLENRFKSPILVFFECNWSKSKLLLVFAGKRASVFHKSIPPFPKKHVPFPGKSRELFNKTIRLCFGGGLNGLWTVSYVVKHMFFVAFYSKASYVCNKTKNTKLTWTI